MWNGRIDKMSFLKDISDSDSHNRGVLISTVTVSIKLQIDVLTILPFHMLEQVITTKKITLIRITLCYRFLNPVLLYQKNQ